ncbi:hypothetical protein BO70DRAFT_432810 [Aspergillus heteromorphus CBS 117.55]|uniref:Uncharacterized protein n=1 Tax=Aspergillus heteromorphus CBS 117.55 TaxID=1448321 RepID=A0A317V6J9_9EURO|nr:uncharacterized protein BO70DRAFT_432810 [Aspergillus heteromorphus CBS 117.55]PWY68482.1 hypothetical protein BO70DRAFT_432810 [Aspergillus heteromorphus CBS 117.55]
MSVLRRAYWIMADILLELSKPTFPFIGAIKHERLDGSITSPFEVFAKYCVGNAADYFDELACQHLYHLEHQRNDAVVDEIDCRKKYIARCLFRKISREISRGYCDGPFWLYCDDLRLESVLVEESSLAVTG